MNFLLNLGNLFAEQEIISAAVSIFLSLAILTSFSLSKKFVNAEFNKIDKQSDDQLERIIVLASGAALSALIIIIFVAGMDLFGEYQLNASPLISKTHYKLVITFSILLIFGYTITAPNHAGIRFLDVSNKEAVNICRKIFRIVTASFLATVVNVFKPSYGVFLGGIMVAYYFAEMLTSKKLIEKALALTESKNRSPSYKLAAFVNRKVVFLCLAAMSSIVFINHSPSNKLFFENLIDIFHVLLAIFALQACISAVINKFICKLESIRDGAHSSSPTSQRQKNLIWICDVIVIVLYLAMACLLLKFIGINLHEHIFHDKTMTVFGIIFITIVIYKGFNEFADTILENAKNNNQDNYKIKLQTFLPTLSAIFYIILFATSALLVLANLGVNIAPILATFTVFSAAVGLAAQDIIRSFLHGITFLIEKNLYVGAYIQIDGKSGVIEKLSARVLYLRDDNGALHVIPYNVINVITNYSKDYSYHYGELHINDGDDVEKVSNILIDVVKNMKKEENYRNSILGEVIVHGLKPFNLTGPKIYWKMKVSPDAAGKAVQYELYRRLYQEYGKRKMHIPIANSIISTVS